MSMQIKKSEEEVEKRKKKEENKDTGGSTNDIGTPKLTSTKATSLSELTHEVTQIIEGHFPILELGFSRFVLREEYAITSLSSFVFYKR